MSVVFNLEDKNRIKEQVVALWAEHCEGMNLVAIRFDQSPVGVEDDDYPSIAFVFTYDDQSEYYLIAWGEVSYSVKGLLQFTEDDLESWSESGESPWEGNQEEYINLVTDVYPEFPEWEHLYL